MGAFKFFKLHYRLCTAIGIGLLIVVFGLTQTLPADAKVAIFDSFFVEREVEVKNDTVTNTIQNLHTHTWSSFSGEIPENVTINEVSLVLLWSQTLDEDVVEAEVEIPTTDAFSNEQELEASSTEVISIDETASTADELDVKIINSEISIPETEEEVLEIVPEDEQTEETPPEEILEEEVIEETVVPENIEESVIEDSPAAFVPALIQEVFSFVNSLIISEVHAQSSEDISSVSEEPISEIDETMIEVTTEEVESEESPEVGSTTEESIEDDAPPAPLYPTLTSASVQYSFDGDSWTNLASINLLETNEAILNLSTEAFDSIGLLQVRVVYLAPQDAVPIIFGNSQLKLDYTPLLVEEAILGPSDQEPNFSVSSVKLDITKDKARAVLLEKGGVLELWAGMIDGNEQIIVWKKLLSGNNLTESLPLDIYKETVFWFDDNGNTLFAYDLKNESLTGTASPSSGDNVFLLIFEKGNQELRATYSPSSSTFDFSLVSS